jgi:phosphoserine phosphatase RsbU/P
VSDTGAGGRRLLRNLNSLLDVSKALALELDVDSLLAVILQKAAGVMDAEMSSIFIHDEAGQRLLVVSGDLGKGKVAIPLGVGIAGHVAVTGQVANVSDAYQDPRFNPEIDKRTGFRTRAVLCAPLFSHKGRLIGVIQVLNKRGGGAFSAEDETLLAAFASHAGVALDRAQLVESALEKERLEEALRVAHEIQMGMLPRHPPSAGGLDLVAALRPARSVGGDLYDFFERSGRTWFALGDVSGKGVGAALFMAVAKTLFRAHATSEASPARVMAKLNEGLSLDNERAMFVTFFAGSLDPESGEIEFCNGGHNPPFLVRASGAVTPLPQAAGCALGIIPGFAFETERLRLDPGDALFLYTDGITEAMNEREEQYSGERLVRRLEALAGRAAQDVLSGVLEDVDAFVGSAAPSDDLTVMVLRRPAS